MAKKRSIRKRSIRNRSTRNRSFKKDLLEDLDIDQEKYRLKKKNIEGPKDEIVNGSILEDVIEERSNRRNNRRSNRRRNQSGGQIDGRKRKKNNTNEMERYW